MEVLVTLAILSVGLMGLAFLQAQGMQLSTGAYARVPGSAPAQAPPAPIAINAR